MNELTTRTTFTTTATATAALERLVLLTTNSWKLAAADADDAVDAGKEWHCNVLSLYFDDYQQHYYFYFLDGSQSGLNCLLSFAQNRQTSCHCQCSFSLFLSFAAIIVDLLSSSDRLETGAD